MERCNDDLIFRLDECKDLTTILAYYVPSDTLAGHEEERSRLRDLWHFAGDVSIAKLLMEIVDFTPEVAVRNLPPRDTEDSRKSDSHSERLCRALRSGAVEVPESRVALVRAFRWATSNLVAGSLIMQKEMSNILNSGFEDYPVNEAFGATNERMAAGISKRIVDGGEQAKKWWAQLGEA